MAALTSIMDGLSNAIVQIRFAKLRNIQRWKREILAVLAQPRDQKRLSLPVSDPTNLLDMVTDQLDCDCITTAEMESWLEETLPLPPSGDFGIVEDA